MAGSICGRCWAALRHLACSGSCVRKCRSDTWLGCACLCVHTACQKTQVAHGIERVTYTCRLGWEPKLLQWCYQCMATVATIVISLTCSGSIHIPMNLSWARVIVVAITNSLLRLYRNGFMNANVGDRHCHLSQPELTTGSAEVQGSFTRGCHVPQTWMKSSLY